MSVYLQLVAGSNTPSGGGAIETRDGLLGFSEIRERIDACCSLLTQSDHKFIGIDARDPVSFLIGFYACSKIGRICVPLNQEDEIRSRFISDILELDLIISAGRVQFQSRDSSAQNAVIGSFDSAIVARSTVLLFTSGTTSPSSKGVFMAGSGISFTCQRMNEVMGINHTAREYILARIDHAFGFGRCHSVLMAGGTIFLPNTLDLRELVAQFEQRSCNGLAAIPSLLSIVLDRFEDLSEGPFASLRYVQTGAMRFARKYRQILARNSAVRGYLHYGLTEVMRATFLDLNNFPDKIHTEGKPFAGVNLAIMNSQAQILGQQQTGEICLRGESLALGYTDKTRWADAMRDGWFHTGDLGQIDRDGFLIFEGRSVDAMNINGNLVYPDDVEERLRPFFGKTQFSVFGAPDEAGVKDDLMYIAYEGTEGSITGADCAQWLQQSGFGILPESIIAVDKLPRNKTGKVQRYVLRQYLSS
jgi:long-chain acyl-CoA synthetase